MENNFSKFGLLILAGAMLSLVFSGCFEPPVSLSKDDKKIIDSLFHVKRKDLKIELDSLCDLRFDRIVNHTVDSIIEERMQEIERLSRKE